MASPGAPAPAGLAGRSWLLEHDGPCSCPLATVGRDEELLNLVHSGDRGPTIRLWTNRQCLVVTRGERDQPGFDDVRQAFEGEGWPIATRITGGTAVVHGPGVLNLSLIYQVVDDDVFSVSQPYILLKEALDLGLGRLGVDFYLGQVEGAFCSGRYDILAAGRKVAGTAQRVRQVRNTYGPSYRSVLVHLSLLVSQDRDAMAARINRYYKAMGDRRRVSGNSCATLADLADSSLSPHDVAEMVKDALLAQCTTVLRS